ncbi:MAG TPA: energy-coupling factor transporter transmembrane component T [Anaerolineaceae bacterium]
MFQYARIPSLLASLDALSKFFSLICIAVLVFIFPPLLNLVLFGAIIFCAAVLGRIDARRILSAVSILFILAVFFLIGGFFYRVGPPLFHIGPLVYTYDALLVRGSSAARIMNVVLSSMLFIWVTNPRDFVTGLVRLGLPYRIAFTIFVGLNYIPILTNEMHYIEEAQTLRGLHHDRSIRSFARQYTTFLVAILLRSLRKAQITAFALDSKGFGAHPERTYLNPFRWTAGGMIWLGLWAALVVASLYASLVLHLWSGYYLAF